jgi:hypothetical protein
MPANGETIAIATVPCISVDMSSVLFKRVLNESIGAPPSKRLCSLPNTASVEGLLVMENNSVQLITLEEANDEYGLPPHDLRFSQTLTLDSHFVADGNLTDIITSAITKLLPDQRVIKPSVDNQQYTLCLAGNSVSMSVTSFHPQLTLTLNWSLQDDHIGSLLAANLVRSLPRSF